MHLLLLIAHWLMPGKSGDKKVGGRTLVLIVALLFAFFCLIYTQQRYWPAAYATAFVSFVAAWGWFAMGRLHRRPRRGPHFDRPDPIE